MGRGPVWPVAAAAPGEPRLLLLLLVSLLVPLPLPPLLVPPPTAAKEGRLSGRSEAGRVRPLIRLRAPRR